MYPAPYESIKFKQRSGSYVKSDPIWVNQFKGVLLKNESKMTRQTSNVHLKLEKLN